MQLIEEGVTWIRGWHTEDSMEVAALLAAWKLRVPPAARIRFDDDTTTVALRGRTFDVLNGQTLEAVLPVQPCLTDRFYALY